MFFMQRFCNFVIYLIDLHKKGLNNEKTVYLDNSCNCPY